MNALGGSLSAELFQDASTYEESISQRDKPQAAQTEGEQPERETQDKDDGNEWREWPLVASDGNTAALIELISQNKVCSVPLFFCLYDGTDVFATGRTEGRHVQHEVRTRGDRLE